MTALNSIPARKILLLLVGIGIGAVFFASYLFRMENPTLKVKVNTQAKKQAGQNEMAAEFANLMAKLKENPKDEETLHTLAEMFSSMEAWDKAATFWRRYLEIRPENLHALNALAVCTYRMNEFEESVRILKRYLEIDPKNAPAHYNLGIIYKYNLSRPDEGRKHLQMAIDLNPDDKELLAQARSELDRKVEEAPKK